MSHRRSTDREKSAEKKSGTDQMAKMKAQEVKTEDSQGEETEEPRRKEPGKTNRGSVGLNPGEVNARLRRSVSRGCESDVGPRNARMERRSGTAHDKDRPARH